MTSLLFHNARVVSLDAARPAAEAVAVRDGRIVAVGRAEEAARALDADAVRVDCAGGALLPAFFDAHLHLLSYAAALRSIDCTGARSIVEIQAALREAAARRPAGAWLRAFGYEETSLREGRHPNRRDLDEAAPQHPVRLVHRSGHASVLNSLALERAGIGLASEEPPGGFIDRELDSGEPSGLLLGMERVIDRAVPPLPFHELAAAVREVSDRLVRAGVTAVQDATHTNGRAEWALFERLIDEGALPLTVVLMEGIEHLGELPAASAQGALFRGPVKVMIEELGDELSPDERELRRTVAEVHQAGRQAAIHAVGARAVAAAIDAIEAALRERPRADHRHRIEHCALLPEGAAERIARAGIIVASQPAFVAERGDRYLKLVPASQQGGLYPYRTLAQASVTLAAGSDAPVTAPEPLASVAAAIDRRTLAGGVVAPGQAVGAVEALGWWTAGAARAAFLEGDRGRILPGLRADLVLLEEDPTACSPEELRRMVPVGVWSSGRRLLP